MTKWHSVILGLVCRFDFLTVTDIYALLGLNDEEDQEQENIGRYIREALKSLSVDHKLLGRFEVKDPVKQEAFTKGKGKAIRRPHYEFIYWLTRKGSETIFEYDSQFPEGSEKRIDPKGQRNPHDKKSSLMLPHDRERSRFFVYLETASGRPVWRRHFDLRHAFTAGKESHVLIPDDAFFFGRYYRFLEVERSQKEFERADGTGIIDKLQKYHVYADPAHRRFLEKWRYTEPDGEAIYMNDFFVNVVMLTEERKWNLLRALGQRGIVQSRFQVTSLESYLGNPPQLLAPIWHTYDGKVYSLEGQGGDLGSQPARRGD